MVVRLSLKTGWRLCLSYGRGCFAAKESWERLRAVSCVTDQLERYSCVHVSVGREAG